MKGRLATSLLSSSEYYLTTHEMELELVLSKSMIEKILFGVKPHQPKYSAFNGIPSLKARITSSMRAAKIVSAHL